MPNIRPERQRELEEQERLEEEALENHRQAKAHAQGKALAMVRVLDPQQKMALLGHLVTLFPETTVMTIAKMAAGHET